MKFFVLFLLLGTVPCWAGIAYSQNVKMSLDMENTTVHDVINAIEKKGNFYFTYNLNQVNVNRKVLYLANLHTSFLCNLIYPTFSRILLYSC